MSCKHGTEEGMVQKNPYKNDNLLGLQMHIIIYNYCWMTRQCEDLTRNMFHAVTTTHNYQAMHAVAEKYTDAVVKFEVDKIGSSK